MSRSDISTLSRMTGKDFSGPVPEIRAPHQQQPAIAAGDEHAENVQDATPNLNEGPSRKPKRKNQNQNQGTGDGGVIVIGDVDDLQTL
jgi:transcription factor TFIIIB component B''